MGECSKISAVSANRASRGAAVWNGRVPGSAPWKIGLKYPCRAWLTKAYGGKRRRSQEVIRLLIEQIVVEDDALIVHHIVPTTDNSQLKPALCNA